MALPRVLEYLVCLCIDTALKASNTQDIKELAERTGISYRT